MTDILLPKNGLTLIRGASKTLLLTVTAPTGKPLDLTGAKVVFTIKTRVDDERPILQKTSAVGAEAAITNAKGGVAEIYLVPADTKNLQIKQYVFDVWVILPAPGNEHFPVILPSVLELTYGVTAL